MSAIRRTPQTVEDVRRSFQRLVSANNRTTIGVDTSDDVVVNDSDSGIVLKASNGHYVRFTATYVSPGVYTLTSTDLGTTRP